MIAMVVGLGVMVVVGAGIVLVVSVGRIVVAGVLVAMETHHFTNATVLETQLSTCLG